MPRTVIEVHQLSKAYQIGQIGTGTISRDLERFVVTKILRRDDPFLKVGEVNDRTVKSDSDIVWSLRDINFDVQEGNAVGIIGKNGAGKSTLLKLLSRVTAPTTGEIRIKGRIASLLEVGTGFHPELTGRENIYLNGAILGMRKKEIDRKIDEIIAFSGCERYIDTPVKRYSSGMTVRLAFAVAAHLEPEILVVDEVLAVGDAEFQKKAIGKMQDISKGEGRTVLFVSHDMTAIHALTDSVIILKNGECSDRMPTDEGIQQYLASNLSQSSGKLIRKSDGDLYVERFLINSDEVNYTQIPSGDPLRMQFFLNKPITAHEASSLAFYVVFRNELNYPVFTVSNRYDAHAQVSDSGQVQSIECLVPAMALAEGKYTAKTWMAFKGGFCDEITDAFEVDVLASNFYHTGQMPIARKHGAFLLNQNWTLK